MCRTAISPPKRPQALTDIMEFENFVESRFASPAPYEYPIDERYPRHFDDSWELRLGFWATRTLSDAMRPLDSALHNETFAEFQVGVFATSAQQGWDLASPQFFVVNVSGDMRHEWERFPGELLWERPGFHDKLKELIKKHFGHIDEFQRPVIRYFEFPVEDHLTSYDFYLF